MAYSTRTNNVAATAIKARKEFRNGTDSLSGGQFGDEYLIYSYATVVARHSALEGWTLTGRKYSQTTGRHMSQIRLALSQLGHEYATAAGELPQHRNY